MFKIHFSLINNMGNTALCEIEHSAAEAELISGSEKPFWGSEEQEDARSVNRTLRVPWLFYAFRVAPLGQLTKEDTSWKSRCLLNWCAH